MYPFGGTTFSGGGSNNTISEKQDKQTTICFSQGTTCVKVLEAPGQDETRHGWVESSLILRGRSPVLCTRWTCSLQAKKKTRANRIDLASRARCHSRKYSLASRTKVLGSHTRRLVNWRFVRLHIDPRGMNRRVSFPSTFYKHVHLGLACFHKRKIDAPRDSTPLPPCLCINGRRD